MKKFDRNTTANEVAEQVNLSGRTALVTGGGAGIGLATTTALARAGARVFVGDVNEERSLAALDEVRRANPQVSIEFVKLDLGSLEAVREFAQRFQAQSPVLDILVNNAGIMACPFGRTVDGFELQLGVNFLGHYVLTRSLLPALDAAKSARIVSVSSIGHRRTDICYEDINFQSRPYDRWEAYGQSKTACALLAIAADELWRDRGIRANTMNPGGSFTSLHQYLSDDERRRIGFLDADNKMPDRWRSPEQCAATSVWLASAPELEGVGGKYFEEFAEAQPWSADDPMKGVRPYAISKPNALRLWNIAADMVGLAN